jgi:acetyl/propionyl-CoA carboxylase alpha subunit/acetyl-CoA carboxylase carboxyltransferase component
VRNLADLPDLFRSAAVEAKNAFGDDRLFLEKMVQRGRHVEVQIVADQHGTVIALGCRDCSVQRRHQKILEEAPPVGLSPAALLGLKQAASGMAREAGYTGVGTVEFLVQGDEYFFLEMNPRLQVEHGITEETTGTDIVQLQIRIARGERLPPLELQERGFAIEARVCAEDPDEAFLPAPGRIARFDPALGPRLRIDTGVTPGSSVPADFDSLIAKVIASGDTREEARARLVCALRDFDLVIAGGATNKSYLLEILDTEDFKRGGVDTGWLDRYNEHREPSRRYAAEALVLAAILAYQKNRENLRANFYADPGNITHDKIPVSGGQQIDLTYQGTQPRVHVYAAGSSRYRVLMDNRAVTAQLTLSGSNAGRLKVGERDLRVLFDVSEATIRVEVEGGVHRFGRQTAGRVSASTPSMVVAVHVKEGDQVEAGQILGLVEAMKMEISFQAPVGGVVTEVHVRRGQQVRAGATLLVIAPAEARGERGGRGETLRLSDEREPLEVLFADPVQLKQPGLLAASGAEPQALLAAVEAVRSEVSRVILGYDAHESRVSSLIEFLEATLPRGLPAHFLTLLSHVRGELVVFADIEQLFLRRQVGQTAPDATPLSNDRQLRTFVRRIGACGAGLDERFLDKLRAALSHYGVVDLEHSDRLERVVLRLFSSQATPALRFRLVGAVLQRVIALAESGVDLRGDAALKSALTRISAMRGHVPDSVADSAISASYRIFQQPELERQAEQTTQRLESWLRATESAGGDSPITLPDEVLRDLALAPRLRLLQLLEWLSAEHPARRSIAVAACVRRFYTPRVPQNQSFVAASGNAQPEIVRMGFATGEVILAAVASSEELGRVARELCEQAQADRSQNDPTRDARTHLELLVTLPEIESRDLCVQRLDQLLMGGLPAERLTVSFIVPGETTTHETWLRSRGEARRMPLFGLHPEAAERIDLGRYQSFHLERLPASEGIYCFYGVSRELPEDERVFVLADVLDRPTQGSDASLYLPLFERVFHEAARTLRLLLATRDPGRRLLWNRMVFLIAHPITLGHKTAQSLAQRWHPTTRHLGLERVAVRMHLTDPKRSPVGTSPVELLVSDLTGGGIDVTWRTPHRAPLVPVSDYVRRVVTAKRRGLVYPYEIIRMLATTEGQTSERLDRDVEAAPSLPLGHFEEFDLDPSALGGPRAVSVAGRAPGQNTSSIVFGIISTPTRKVPEGMRRVLLLSDPTRDMGALAAPECDRVVAAIDLAERLSLPVEWLPVSSGARIAMDSGTENLDSTARVVRRIVTFTQRGGAIHMIVAGVNVGAQSYWDALATMLLHTRGVLIMTPKASMVLTGSAALAASGSISAEDEVSIGGYERVMGPNGQAQYFAGDLAEAYRILYEHYRYSYVVPGEKRPRRLSSADPLDRNVLESPYSGDGFALIGDIFSDATNPGRKKAFAMRTLMSAVIDTDGGHLERWESQTGAETAIVWDAHLGGHAVCLIGVESQNTQRWGYRPLDGPAEWNGGTLFPQSSKKIARTLNSVSGNRPAVVLANLSGFDGSPESMRKLQLEYGAEIARAVVNFEGPLVFLVVSRYHGGAYVVFSRELNPNLRAFALEGSFASVIGGGPAAAVVFSREVRSRVMNDSRIKSQRRTPNSGSRADLEKLTEAVKLEKQAELAAEFDAIHTVERARRVGSLEAILPAARLRIALIEALAPK